MITRKVQILKHIVEIYLFQLTNLTNWTFSKHYDIFVFPSYSNDVFILIFKSIQSLIHSQN